MVARLAVASNDSERRSRRNSHTTSVDAEPPSELVTDLGSDGHSPLDVDAVEEESEDRVIGGGLPENKVKSDIHEVEQVPFIETERLNGEQR